MIKSLFIPPPIPLSPWNSRKNTIPPGGFHQIQQHVIIQPSNMCLKYFPILQPWQKKIRRTKWWAYGGFPFLLGLFLQILIQNPDWVPMSVHGRKGLGSPPEPPRKSSASQAGCLRFKSRLTHQRDSRKAVSFLLVHPGQNRCSVGNVLI